MEGNHASHSKFVLKYVQEAKTAVLLKHIYKFSRRLSDLSGTLEEVAAVYEELIDQFDASKQSV